MDVTPDMDISKQIASGETHRPVLRGKSAKDVHWYVTSACDFMDLHGDMNRNMIINDSYSS